MDEQREPTHARHTPVLAERIVELFTPAVRDAAAPAVLVDATLGLGGHTEALLDAFDKLTVLGLDRDPEAIALASSRLSSFGDRFLAVRAVYDELPTVLADRGIGAVCGVLFDLGVSSLQLDAPARGFAYAVDTPLDMRMDPTGGITAAEVLNTYTVDELSRVLRDYGEERFAVKIARAIVAQRAESEFTTSAALVELLYRVVPAATRRTGGHPAKRTFQALRIEVNSELAVLREAIPTACDALRIGGRIVVESYQSLEDRIVKRALAERATSNTPPGLPVELPGHGPRFRLVTRGAERAGEGEIAANPRAGSVRLRAAQRLAVS